MGLVEKRSTFLRIRETCKVLVKRHSYSDHPERKFTKLELLRLVRFGTGRITDNRSPEAILDSFLFFPKDDEGRECKLVVKLEEYEMDEGEKEMILVCSAYREVAK